MKKHTAKMIFFFCFFFVKVPAAILKTSPTVGENILSGHFGEKKKGLPIFQTVFFFFFYASATEGGAGGIMFSGCPSVRPSRLTVITISQEPFKI